MTHNVIFQSKLNSNLQFLLIQILSFSTIFFFFLLFVPKFSYFQSMPEKINITFPWLSSFKRETVATFWETNKLKYTYNHNSNAIPISSLVW